MPRGQPGSRCHRQYDPLTVLDYIDRHHTEQGRSPSERQIMRGADLRGTGIAHDLVRRLVARGLLLKTIIAPSWPAELELTAAGREALTAWRSRRESLLAGAAPAVPTVEAVVRGAA